MGRRNRREADQSWNQDTDDALAEARMSPAEERPNKQAPGPKQRRLPGILAGSHRSIRFRLPRRCWEPIAWRGSPGPLSRWGFSSARSAISSTSRSGPTRRTSPTIISIAVTWDCSSHSTMGKLRRCSTCGCKRRSSWSLDSPNTRCGSMSSSARSPACSSSAIWPAGSCRAPRG